MFRDSATPIVVVLVLLSIVGAAVYSINRASDKIEQPRYDLQQELMYAMERPVVITKIFFFHEGNSFLGKEIFRKVNRYTPGVKRRDSLEAVDFIEEHKKFN